MHGHHHHLHPYGGAPPIQPPPPGQPPPPPQFPQNPNLYSQRPPFSIPQNPPFFQTPTFRFPQNPSSAPPFSLPPPQNPNFSIPQNLPPSSFPQNPTISSPSVPHNSIPPQNPNSSTPPQQKQPKTTSKPTLDDIQSVIIKAHDDLLAKGETVSALCITQSALSSLQVDSWDSLDVQMKQITPLHNLIALEGKVNAFINCFVVVRQITSLYELEVAICEAENVERFDDLKLGPFLRHPLVVQYFNLPLDVKEVYRITTEEIISRLVEFLDICKSDNFKLERFLEFIADKECVEPKEKLGVRIRNLKSHVTYIRNYKIAEESTLKNYFEVLKQKSSGQSREQSPSSSHRIDPFSPVPQLKSDGFLSSGSEDENDVDSRHEGKENDNTRSSHRKISSQDKQSSELRVSDISDPSMAQFGGLEVSRSESSPISGTFNCDTSRRTSGKNRTAWDQSSNDPSCRSSKRYLAESSVVKAVVFPENTAKQSHDALDENPDLTLTDSMINRFISTWKDACRVHTVDEVFERMINFYNSPAQGRKKMKSMFGLLRLRKKMKSLFSTHPCIGLLNIAIKSIKCGMHLNETLEAIGHQHGCITPSSARADFESAHIELSKEKNALSDNVHSSQPEHNSAVITVDDILKKVASYFENDHGVIEGKSMLEKLLIYLRMFRDCEIWLTEQFSVKEFACFGYGEFLKFLEGNSSRLYNPASSMDAQEALENQLIVKSSDGHDGELHCEEKDLTRESEETGDGCIVKVEDATLVIDSIRHEEFGLVPNLTQAEGSRLKKQHARLGRALHYLSQELYAQDSHLLLELVQNADDNVYPESVEPTLVFILQATGIIVLNNELGFSAQNVRAICDVGNSTKGGSCVGYIRQKGIGFKSVFRVTDAPEIHSNGFHFKFDRSEGQIGFVLPTVVSPCDVDFYGRLVPGEVIDRNSWWKTCMVLPFKSKLKEGRGGMGSIISMFTDLHPSLLLFLHRLQCIKFKNMLTNDCIVMKRETLGDGIVKISHGKEKMCWFVASQKLQDSVGVGVGRPNVQTTEIAIAFALEETGTGEYKPRIEQQPVFAFLPLRMYGLKFILQGDFVLPSSREDVDGDSIWNQWLLSEFPCLFVSALKSFCVLPCFQESPGKAVTAYMSFVPLAGEVHGFFSRLPHMIISKLRVSSCLLVEGHDKEWVTPCSVLRGWDEQACSLLPESLLNQHLGLGYLDKDIILSGPLAKALGVHDYGPKILVDIISSICQEEGGIESMGHDWLSSWLSALYTMLPVHSATSTLIAEVELDLITRLRQIPFIPLSDGTYSSMAEGTIWLHSFDSFSNGFEGGLHGPDVFPSLYAKLRTVSATILSSANANINDNEEETIVNNNRKKKMLKRIGIQQLSAHDILTVHIVPAISDDGVRNRDKSLMTEYLSFAMLHLQSNCPRCVIEREDIISELRNKAFVLTNHGYKRPSEVSIHFSKEFGNPVDVNKLIDAMEFQWHEVDIVYLKKRANANINKTSSLFCRMKWREFFQELGITDFVRIIQVEKKVADVPRNLMYDGVLISPGSALKDWESPELVSLLLSTLSSQTNHENCKYLLEVLDRMWDEVFSSKVSGSCTSKSNEDVKLYRSLLIKSIQDIQWVVSSMDQELHYPRDLFHDSEAVRSILGAFAPYAVPQVRSKKFISDVGFKTKVTLDDALRLLEVWSKCKPPFRTSIAQMSKFYSLISDGVADNSKEKITGEFSSRPSIFVPFEKVSRHDDVIDGMFLSRDDVYWHDPTGFMDLAKELLMQHSSTNGNCHFINTLAQVYHGLHDFFVNECGVCENPPLRRYVHILLQLSNVASPSLAANAVFRVILKWADDLKSGFMGPEDILYLKEIILELENKVLPTVHGEWVSLHPTFGLVCWCDDKELKKQFMHSDHISFVDFGELSNDEEELLPAKISRFMHTIGIPALSEVVTREVLYDGVEDYKDKASLVHWVLPFAQRYIYKLHPNQYIQLKQSLSENLTHLQIVVAVKLSYRYTLKGFNGASQKCFECSCLLQENVLYMTRDSDSHLIFLELSRLFFDGTPELHMANFLHMITTMAESGCTKEQTEFVVVNSQKIPKLPNDEPVWCLPRGGPTPSSAQEEFEISAITCSQSTTVDEQNQSSKSKRKRGNDPDFLPPVNKETSPEFHFPQTKRFRRRRRQTLPPANESSQMKAKREVIMACSTEDLGIPVGVNWVIQDESVANMAASLQDLRTTEEDQPPSDSLITTKGGSSTSSEVFNEINDRDHQLISSFASKETTQTAKSAITGRLGEFVAFKYFAEKVGDESSVNWVNKDCETGLPYDIVIGKDEESKEYIEVKATKFAKKDWFTISLKEWQCAVEKGDSFSIAHVALMDLKNTKVTVLKNPFKLCQQGTLQLAVMMSRNPYNLSSLTQPL